MEEKRVNTSFSFSKANNIVNKKRIAVFHNLPKGGGLRHLDSIIKILSKHHTVDLYIPQNNSTFQVVPTSVTKKYIEYPQPFNFLSLNKFILFNLPKIHAELAKRIDSKKYDLVIINHDYLTKAPYLLRFLRTPSIYFLHEPQREYYENWNYLAPYFKDKVTNSLRMYTKLIERQNTKYATCVVVNSKYSKRIINNIFGVNPQLIYPRVDSTKFKPLLRRKKKIILSIGSLSRVKGHDFLIRSLKDILGEYKLVIIGDGKKVDEKYLMSLAPHKNNFIKIIPYLDEKKLIKVYNSSMLLCIGAHFEPFGLSSIEAQSCGTPVVAVNEGGLPETIRHNHTGYISPRLEKTFLAYTIKALSNYKWMGENARQYVLKTWDSSLLENEILSLINL